MSEQNSTKGTVAGTAICPLVNFLNKFKTKEKDFTHTWLGHPKASYKIPEDNHPELFKLLHKKMFIDDRDAFLTEKPFPVANIKIDLDFRYEMDTNKRQHSKELIQEIVQIFNQAITEYLEVPEEQLKAYVFQRSLAYKLKGYTRDGVHIMYPEIVTQIEAQYAIRKRVLELCESIFAKLPVVNTKEDIIDKAVIGTNNWLMYGCTKPGLPRYELINIYDHQLEDLPIINDPLDLMIKLSNFNPNKNQYMVQIRPEMQSEINYLGDHPRTSSSNTKKAVKRQQKKYLQEGSGNSMEEIRALVKMLSRYRAETYEAWIQVGWCLHNIDHSLLGEWVEFSKKSEKYQDGECQKMWCTFREDGYYIGSLHRWARQDSPDEYDHYKRERLMTFVERSITGTTFDIATVVHQMYRYDYVCASFKNNIWYEFKNHRWRVIDSGVTLMKHLSNEVLNEFLRLITFYNQSALGEKDEFKDQFLIKSKQMTEVTFKLRDMPFKEKIMKECRIIFHDPQFCTKLDANPHTIGFENGVYDLNKQEFRDGRPEDYISLSTEIDYEYFESTDQEISDVYEFFSQVFPIERLRTYFLTLMASYLLGSNPDQKFHIWLGVGANGKSAALNFYEMTFGQYTGKLPVSFMTQGRQSSNSASPEISRLVGKRFVSMQEPDEKTQFNIGILKEFSGSDKLIARPLFRDPIEFIPQFKLALLCNHLPTISDVSDKGTWRRIRTIPFMSVFCDEPDPEDKFQFKKDAYLMDKLECLKSAFMYILIQHYAIYKKNGIVEPPEVLQATKEYQEQCDKFMEYKQEFIEKDPQELIKLEDAYSRFKSWYKLSYDSKVPPRKDFKKNMERILGNYNVRKGWVGWKFLEDDDGLEIDEMTETVMPDITPDAFRDRTPITDAPVTPNIKIKTPKLPSTSTITSTSTTTTTTGKTVMLTPKLPQLKKF
jgi:P4 family phage/plasmid primase-like protien